jgi:sugar phosphate isomerase/epimerase
MVERDTPAPLTGDVQRVAEQVHINMPWQQLPHYLNLVLQLRFNLEIGVTGADLDGLARPEVQRIAAQLSGQGCRITLHAPFWDLSAGSIDPFIRQVTRLRLQQFLDMATLFQPVQMVCHGGYDSRHHGSDWQRYLERSLDLWETLLVRAEMLKVPLLLENVWEESPDFHRTLFARLPSAYLGFCLDVGHQHSFSKTDLTVWLEAMQDWLCEIHLHDNHGDRDAHLPVGQGNIDFEVLFRFLKKTNKRPVLTLEPHQESHLFESLAGLADLLQRMEFQ